MSQSREALVARALHKLGVIGAGQSGSAEDTQLVNGTVDTVLSDLASRNIYQWGDPDQIDDDAFEHLAELIAEANARDFGADRNEQNRLLAESRLRQLQPTLLSGQS